MSIADVYLVSSDEYEVRGPGWYDAPETVRDTVIVRCRTKRRARTLAVRYWRHANQRSGRRYRPPFESVTWGENPFRGLRVEKLSDLVGG